MFSFIEIYGILIAKSKNLVFSIILFDLFPTNDFCFRAIEWLNFGLSIEYIFKSSLAEWFEAPLFLTLSFSKKL